MTVNGEMGTFSLTVNVKQRRSPMTVNGRCGWMG